MHHFVIYNCCWIPKVIYWINMLPKRRFSVSLSLTIRVFSGRSCHWGKMIVVVVVRSMTIPFLPSSANHLGLTAGGASYRLWRNHFCISRFSSCRNLFLISCLLLMLSSIKTQIFKPCLENNKNSILQVHRPYKRYLKNF